VFVKKFACVMNFINMKVISILLYFLLIHINVLAQVDSVMNMTDVTEVNTIEQEEQMEEFVFHQKKLNINKINETELFALGILDKAQIDSIITYRNNYGPIQSMYELQNINNINIDKLKLLNQYVQVHELQATPLKQMIKESQRYEQIRWSQVQEKSRGYKTNAYAGSNHYFQYRFRSSYNPHYQIGFMFEKDAGEKLDIKHIDYISSYVLIRPKKIVKEIILGDFHFQAGHGLIFGNPFFISKNPEYWSTAWRTATGFKGHSSSNEYNFYRGIGTRIQHGNASFSFFASKTNQDAYLQNDHTFSSINTSGLHRSWSEIKNKNSIQLNNIGTQLSQSFFKERLKINIGYLMYHYSHAWKPYECYYSQNKFQGKELYLYGLDLQYQSHSTTYFIEIAKANAKGEALYAGMIKNFSKETTFITHIWYANENYHSYYGNIIRYQSEINNEMGVYQGLQLQVSNKIRWALGASVYKNPKPTYQQRFTNYGNELITRLTYQLKKKTILYAQYRQQQIDNYTLNTDSLNESMEQFVKQNYLLDLIHHENLNWSIHSRIQWSRLGLNDHSYSISQAVQFQIKKMKIKFQYFLFDCKTWANRIYEYEINTPQSFSLPALYGQGSKLILVFSYPLLQQTQFYFKWHHTELYYQNNIGSGLEEIEGNQKNIFYIQVRHQF
jgi:hypothetical protein